MGASRGRRIACGLGVTDDPPRGTARIRAAPRGRSTADVNDDARADVVSRQYERWRYPMKIAYDLRDDAALLDTFLHHRARSYTVDECLATCSQRPVVPASR